MREEREEAEDEVGRAWDGLITVIHVVPMLENT